MINNTVAGYDRIWHVAQNVWKSITSSMGFRAFVLAYRKMQKIIHENCNNAWLCNGTPHASYDVTTLTRTMGFYRVKRLSLLCSESYVLIRMSMYKSNYDFHLI